VVKPLVLTAVVALPKREAGLQFERRQMVMVLAPR
jgi:hypothetical protein